MRVNEPRGVRTLASFGPKIRQSVQAQPDGLLLHENLLFSLFPPHAGMRQYWRDFDSLERWARSWPHQQWWQQFLRDRGGTGFWHETYFRGGQIESVYIDMPATGLAKFAPVTPAAARCFQPAAAWACGKEADRRRASWKKSCISGKAWRANRPWGQRRPHRHHRLPRPAASARRVYSWCRSASLAGDGGPCTIFSVRRGPEWRNHNDGQAVTDHQAARRHVLRVEEVLPCPKDGVWQALTPERPSRGSASGTSYRMAGGGVAAGHGVVDVTPGAPEMLPISDHSLIPGHDGM
jgi:hypothetical protein